jgi:hypothetical protein
MSKTNDRGLRLMTRRVVRTNVDRASKCLGSAITRVISAEWRGTFEKDRWPLMTAAKDADAYGRFREMSRIAWID